jgi:hypothetical protein
LMKSRRWLVVGLTLPIVVLLGWFLYEQTLIWITPAPHWIAGKGQSSYHFCRGLKNWIVDEVEPVEDMQPARITREQAGDIMERVLARHYGFIPLFKANGPLLVRAAFPDGQWRLAWYEVVLIDSGGASLEGKATAVYIDALSGEPLLIIPDAAVGDPCMTCGCPAINLPFRIQQFLALGLLIGYLLMLAVIGGAVWLWRRLAAKKGL